MISRSECLFNNVYSNFDEVWIRLKWIESMKHLAKHYITHLQTSPILTSFCLGFLEGFQFNFVLILWSYAGHLDIDMCPLHFSCFNLNQNWPKPLKNLKTLICPSCITNK